METGWRILVVEFSDCQLQINGAILRITLHIVCNSYYMPVIWRSQRTPAIAGKGASLDEAGNGLIQARIGKKSLQKGGHLPPVFRGELGKLPQVAGRFRFRVKSLAHELVVALENSVPHQQLLQR